MQKTGIKLKFIKTFEIIYKEFKNEFVPNLAIIDLMTFNSEEQIIDFLDKYELNLFTFISLIIATFNKKNDNLY